MLPSSDHIQLPISVLIGRPKDPHAVDSTMSNQIIVSHLPNVKQDTLKRL